MEGSVLPKSHILIVDDAETHRFLLRNIIMEMGYQPVLAENGSQALKIFPRCNPRLVLLDISMPDMDGYEVCRQLKESMDTSEVPILFMSAFENTTEIVKVFEAGGADYITKPFVPEAVKARIGLHIKLADAMKKLAEG